MAATPYRIHRPRLMTVKPDKFLPRQGLSKGRMQRSGKIAENCPLARNLPVMDDVGGKTARGLKGLKIFVQSLSQNEPSGRSGETAGPAEHPGKGRRVGFTILSKLVNFPSMPYNNGPRFFFHQKVCGAGEQKMMPFPETG